MRVCRNSDMIDASDRLCVFTVEFKNMERERESERAREGGREGGREGERQRESKRGIWQMRKASTCTYEHDEHITNT